MPAEIEVPRLLISLADPAVTLHAPSAVVVRQALLRREDPRPSAGFATSFRLTRRRPLIRVSVLFRRMSALASCASLFPLARGSPQSSSFDCKHKEGNLEVASLCAYIVFCSRPFWFARGSASLHPSSFWSGAGFAHSPTQFFRLSWRRKSRSRVPGL